DDGAIEVREAVGRAVRVLEGRLTPDERAEAAAAVREADLGAMIDVPAASFPRVRSSWAPDLAQERELTISDSGPVAARLSRLRALLEQVTARLRAEATPGWVRIHRSSHHPAVNGSIELERAGAKARLSMQEWVPLTPAELA